MCFFLSKLAWALIEPGSLLVFILLAGVAMLGSRRAATVKRGRVLCAAAAFFCLVLAVFPVGSWALTPLENRFTFTPPPHADGVIVIGGDEKPQIAQARRMPVVALDSMRRYVTFLDMARRYPHARLVFSGGPPYLRPLGAVQDADVARENLADIGVPVDRMLFETKSRNTYENAVFTAALVHPTPVQTWILVTSAWHMPRAMGCFRRAGWNVIAAPTGYFTTGKYQAMPVFRFGEQMHLLTMAMHEYVGLAAYWLMGRTDALWPG